MNDTDLNKTTLEEFITKIEDALESSKGLLSHPLMADPKMPPSKSPTTASPGKSLDKTTHTATSKPKVKDPNEKKFERPDTDDTIDQGDTKIIWCDDNPMSEDDQEVLKKH